MGLFLHNIAKARENDISFFDKKTLGITDEQETQRPADGYLNFTKEEESIIVDKRFTVRYRDLYNLSKISDSLQIIFNTRARKTFREGFEIEPRFERANKTEKKEIEKWIRKCNNNGQSLKEVFMELDKDLNWADDAYLLCVKDYGYNAAGDIVAAEVKEFARMHPLSVELVLDRNKRLGRYYMENKDGSSIAYTSPANRTVLTNEPFDKHTGKKNIQAHYRISTEEGFLYYNASEVLHKSAFNPSLTYGYSPLFSLYNKVLVLMLQDSYIKKYYGDDKPTKGLLVFNTQNKQALMKTFDEIRQNTLKNPHSVKPIISESSDGRKPVEYIDMSKTLNEMQFTDQRDEYRQQIGAMYGVSPMFQNDMSTGGGLNNEGLQITVTNEVIQDRQHLFDDSFLKFVFEENLGFTDYDVNVTPDIEQDLMAEEQLKFQELTNAKTMLELGLEGKYTKDGEIIFSEGKLELQEPDTPGFMPFDASKAEIGTPLKIEDEVLEEIAGEGVEKADAKTEAKERTKLDNKLQKEIKDIVGGLELTPNQSEESILKKVEGIAEKLGVTLKKTASSVFAGIYERFAKDTSKEIKTKFEMTKEDKDFINSLKEDPNYLKAFGNLTEDLTNLVRVKVRNHFQNSNSTLDMLTNDIIKETNLSKERARTIARSETWKISAGATKKQLEKTGAKYEYKHAGVIDNRTSDSTKDMIKLTKDYVSWEGYLKFARQVTNKYNPKWRLNPSAPLLHPNQRSRFLFRRVQEE